MFAVFQKKSFICFTCALFIAFTLAACGDARKMVQEKYSGARYGEPVKGSRRQPLLNAEYNALNVPPPALNKAEQASDNKPDNKNASNKDISPYDKYNEKGEDVTRKNYFAEWFGGNSSDNEKSEAVVDSQKNNRKKFRGFISENKEIAENKEEEKEIVRTDSNISQGSKKITVPASKIYSDEENGVYVPVVDLKSGGGGEIDVDSKYPHLASVPRVPKEIAEIRRGKDEDLNQLQLSHAASLEQKKQLEEEPSDLPQVTLPQVDNMIKDIGVALRGDVPIVESAK